MRYFKGEAYLEVIYANEAVVYDQKNDAGRMLQVDFDIKMSRSKTPNQGVIAIYNLAETDRRRIERDAKSVRLYAGYDGDNKLIFVGDVVFVSTAKEDVDWKTEIKAGDGFRSFSQSITSRNYAAGTPIRTIIEQTAKDMGIALKESANILKGSLDGSITLHGKSQLALDQVVRNAGGQWSIQDNELQVTPITKPIDGEAIVLDSSSGLLEAPSVSEKGVNIRCQFHPDLRPGKVVKLESSSWTVDSGGTGVMDGSRVKKDKKSGKTQQVQKEKTYPVERGKDYNGFYICQSVQFVGNNAGGPFECRLETIELPNAT